MADEPDTLRDPLTGLPGRTLFLDRLEQALARGRRRPDKLCAVLLLDLDGFAAVNEGQGRARGDELLRAVAVRLQQGLRGADSVARLGGDAFAFLIEEVEGVPDATRTASRVLADVSAPFEVSGQPVSLSGSIGVVIGVTSYPRAEDVLRDAAVALDGARARGTGHHQVFDRALGPPPA